jgi:hypothetical protein
VGDAPKKEREVLIPEVLPPERGPFGSGPRPSESKTRRAQRAFGPIVAGAILDAVDFMTMGPAGLILGFIAGFWIGSIFDLPLRQRLLLAILSAWYGLLPIPRFIPIATLIGAYVQFRGK